MPIRTVAISRLSGIENGGIGGGDLLERISLLRKQAALAAHRSQLGPRSHELGAVLGPAILERSAWRTEYYFV